ncbi:hypothetical protein [Clostridium saccharoperbutylacetonicum]|uniref:hypothetical protein n=1 Tax=Clostridium saccharoperbutylacetonicum TaxID=36745 RepID=UPI0039EC7F08
MDQIEKIKEEIYLSKKKELEDYVSNKIREGVTNNASVITLSYFLENDIYRTALLDYLKENKMSYRYRRTIFYVYIGDDVVEFDSVIKGIEKIDIMRYVIIPLILLIFTFGIVVMN